MVIADFQVARTPKIYFGAGKFRELPNIVTLMGQNVLLVTGTNSLQTFGKLATLIQAFREMQLEYVSCSVSGEPTPEFIDDTVATYKTRQIDVVVAIGGGSVIDAGKAISAMLTADDSVVNYLEGVSVKNHDGLKVPFIAVPTTAGTGSEATKNAVLSRIGSDGFKSSLRHENFVPNIALVDPELALTCPPAITAACGMDALVQLLEAYVSTQASPFTDALAWSGIEHLQQSLIPVCTTRSQQIEARTDMAYAALMSGIVLSNAGLGIVHGLAGPIGGLFHIPHGVVCGTLIGAATKVNIDYLKKEGIDHIALKKYAAIGRLISGEEGTDIEAGCQLLLTKLESWIDKLQLPRLSVFGIRRSDVSEIVKRSAIKNNPARPAITDINQILLERL